MERIKRRLWNDESMVAAIKYVEEGKGLREAARLHNVLVESLRRRIIGTVEPICRPGPPTVLTLVEEESLERYIMNMADIEEEKRKTGISKPIPVVPLLPRLRSQFLQT